MTEKELIEQKLQELATILNTMDDPTVYDGLKLPISNWDNVVLKIQKKFI